MKPGYWAFHKGEYQRFSVEKDVTEFCGWDLLLDLIRECEKTEYRKDECEFLRKRDKGLVAALFETGGRVIEVLLLIRDNFEVSQNRVRVKDMRILKRFDKVGEWMEERKERPVGRRGYRWKWNPEKEVWQKPRWQTELKSDTRGKITMPREEPLVPPMLEWLDKVDYYLFPAGKKRKGDVPHLSASRAYQIVTDLGGRLGVKICDHWFRAQRASQLVEEYNFDLKQLLRFFGWRNIPTALKYAHLSTKKLEEVMQPRLLGKRAE